MVGARVLAEVARKRRLQRTVTMTTCAGSTTLAASMETATGPAENTDSKRVDQPRVTYISWAESCSRSDHTARELGGTSHMIYAKQFGSRAYTVLLKYAAQWIGTSRVLRTEQPNVVFVMTPPLFAALPALLYARKHRKRLILDAHSAAFLHPRWRHFQGLQRALCRKAATTLVHNEHIAALVREAGG